MQREIVGLIPVREGSQRVPGKNYRDLANKPLFHYVLTSLLACPKISQVIVNTDSPIVIEGLQKHFPEVHIIKRPENLCGDTVPMNDILLYDTSQVQADFYLQTHSTNPLLRTETISRVIEAFIENHAAYDSLFSVTRLQTRLWDASGAAINHDPSLLLRTQDLPPVYEENSCVYIFTREKLSARNNRIGDKPMMFEIDAAEAWDIDDELDFEIVEFLMKQNNYDVQTAQQLG